MFTAQMQEKLVLELSDRKTRICFQISLDKGNETVVEFRF